MMNFHRKFSARWNPSPDAQFLPGGSSETDTDRFCPSADVAVIGLRSGTLVRAKMESMKSCAACRVSRNTRLITRTVVMERSEQRRERPCD